MVNQLSVSKLCWWSRVLPDGPNDTVQNVLILTGILLIQIHIELPTWFRRTQIE